MTEEANFFNSIREILKINRITREERQIIDGWRQTYSNSEISEALKKAIENHARVPIGKYTEKILSENRDKLQRGSRGKEVVLPKYYIGSQSLSEEDIEEKTKEDYEEIEKILMKIQNREESYRSNGYCGKPEIVEKQLKEVRELIAQMS